MTELGERVANLDARLDANGQDLAGIRDAVHRLDDKVEARFLSLEGRMAAGFAELRTEMHANFRWVIGGIRGAVAAVLLSILTQIFTG